MFGVCSVLTINIIISVEHYRLIRNGHVSITVKVIVMIVSLNALALLWMEGQSFNEAVEHLAECVNFGCVWICDQTIEELPLEFDSASGSSSNMDATGLPPAASRGNAMSPAMFSLIDGDYNAVSPRSSAGYLGSTRSSRPRRSFHAEHSLGANGAAGSEEPTYPSIKSDK